MDSWLKAAREQAAKIGEDIQKQAILLAEDAGKDGKREFFFGEGPLGFELDGVYVAVVDPDGQAEQLGVQTGDKLVSIAGYVIPENPKEESVKRWLDEMIRPGTLMFFSEAPKAGAPISTTAVVFPKESDTAESGLAGFDEESWKDDRSASPTDLQEDAAATPAVPELPESMMGEARLRAELYASRDEVRSLQRELEDCKAECQGLRQFQAEKAAGSVTEAMSEQRLQRLNEQLTAARKEAEVARGRCRQLQAQLDKMSTQCSELRKESAQNEDRAREAMEGREKVLVEEVERLRETIHNLKTEHFDSLRSLEMEVRNGQDKIEEMEKRLAQAGKDKSEVERLVQESVTREMTAEKQADIARKELCKLEACHMSEVSSLQARYDRQVGDLQRRIEELETEKASSTEAAKVEASEEREKDGEAVAESSPVAGGSFDTVEDVGELHSRIHVLENQCIRLQKKLTARPVVYQTPGANRRRAANLARSTGMVGVVRDIVEELLRNFTERLLLHDAFLWVFYGHLCVLYVIASSCYAQTGVTSSTTLDIDLHSKQALRGIPPG